MSSLTLLGVAGAAQGLFLSTLLFARKSNHPANRVLSVTMLAFSLGILSSLFHAAGYFYRFPHLIGVTAPFPFLYGPLIYLYALILCTPGRQFRAGDLIHFIPFVANYMYFLPGYLISGAEKIAIMEGLASVRRPDIFIIDQLKVVQGLAYLASTVLLLRRYQRLARDQFSSLDRINLKWLRTITIGIGAIWGSLALLQLLRLGGIILFSSMDAYVAVALPIFVYAAGYLGLRQPEIFHQLPGQTPGGMPDATEEDTTAQRYRKSGLAPDRADEIRTLIGNALEHSRAFTDPGLTLHKLSLIVGVSEHHLSEVINSRFGLSFYDLINGYRVREAQARILDPKSRNFSLLAIGFDSGFSSKSSFNAVFKKHTGMTPSEFRENGAAGTINLPSDVQLSSR